MGASRVCRCSKEKLQRCDDRLQHCRGRVYGPKGCRALRRAKRLNGRTFEHRSSKVKSRNSKVRNEIAKKVHP